MKCKEIDILTGETTLAKWFLVPSKKGSVRQEFAPQGEQILSFRSSTLSEEVYFAGRQTGSQKLSPLYKTAEHLLSVSYSLRLILVLECLIPL